jgi:site-specific recombinase XerD
MPSVLTASQAHSILQSIDPSTSAGLRDRALLGILNFALARVAAVVDVRLGDYRYGLDWQLWTLRLTEKGGKPQRFVVHPTLKAYLDEYIEMVVRTNYGENEDIYLFPSDPSSPASRPMSRQDAWRIIRNRGAAIGIQVDPYWLKAPESSD